MGGTVPVPSSHGDNTMTLPAKPVKEPQRVSDSHDLLCSSRPDLQHIQLVGIHIHTETATHTDGISEDKWMSQAKQASPCSHESGQLSRLHESLPLIPRRSLADSVGQEMTPKCRDLTSGYHRQWKTIDVLQADRDVVIGQRHEVQAQLPGSLHQRRGVEQSVRCSAVTVKLPPEPPLGHGVAVLPDGSRTAAVRSGRQGLGRSSQPGKPQVIVTRVADHLVNLEGRAPGAR